ncbi:GIY-YIG nuclease family protein [Streptomyces sp. NPDC059866]|uniref:GIY-YIG nuclease family protein n=1 Tax=Streptomyces sp. NPDC059866 TaxID=3346978 RepID=UPI0036660388
MASHRGPYVHHRTVKRHSSRSAWPAAPTTRGIVPGPSLGRARAPEGTQWRPTVTDELPPPAVKPQVRGDRPYRFPLRGGVQARGGVSCRSGTHFPGLASGRLLYVGMAPRHMSNRTSIQNLRKRVRYHYRGNAAGSTLRLTLGCLLGLELRRVGSGTRLTFGKAGEARLSQWMAGNAQVCWLEHEEPWTMESELISQLDLPLNLDQNRRNGFHDRLKELRAKARERPRALPISA